MISPDTKGARVSIHLEAAKGDVAEIVLMPGDPNRATVVAEKYLEGAKRYNARRAAYGYTGTWKGQRVSVQASGMGVPSIGIYAHELINEYGARTLIRFGTCGSIQKELKIGALVAAMSSCTTAGINRHTFPGDYAPTADFGLLATAHRLATERNLPLTVGSILTADTFYDEPGAWHIWEKYGVLGIEMETAMLYTLASRFGVKALTICTVSDELHTGAAMSGDDRERSLDAMIRLALDTATAAGPTR